MAKHGNRKNEVNSGPKGPCNGCGVKKGPFKPARLHSPTGKAKMVQYCEECMPTTK